MGTYVHIMGEEMELFLIIVVILFCVFCGWSNMRSARKYSKGIRNRSHKNGKVSYFYRVPYTKEQLIGMLRQKSGKDRLDFEFDEEKMEICLSNKYHVQEDAVSLLAQGTANKSRATKGKWFDVIIEEREDCSVLQVMEQSFLTPRTASEVFGTMNAFFVEKLGAIPYEA